MVDAVVREAVAEDLAEILAVERATREAPHWSEAVWQSALAGDGVQRHVFVAEIAERLVGFVVVGLVAGVAELESVAVALDVRRAGLGRALCVRAMEWARCEGAVEMELEVRASSAAARALYASLGFREQGVRAKYYCDPADDAVLMAAALGGDAGVA
jgi:ribosomal-protein-alanine N-acetyltransferase